MNRMHVLYGRCVATTATGRKPERTPFRLTGGCGLSPRF
ncbi:hypothetical protein SBRY_20991 [Actinacidiphila bryophytorum]|uniref:Uncharacterized protein n=1 Tax=Actinacidiphila bryophytorum TaxID=1436133 RepID=A0A9W4E8C1_9ACTN|nr:hypothetical protein SBRY_20991 [Actinacidiphila bryophytorum]